ncbi:GIY-YIG nuclease family protein [Thiomicrorhabdus sp.]|uniref:GIY-YIG nuclease family protein n=1 Tax=Thiomicrorhabdus sp. TaxID=2039724 RepID=UPI0029C69684|nr:GIY-YIG nuclease family protein [Thiomicrorhabdus sp.]
MNSPDPSFEGGWQVYLLRCADQSLYCGISNQLEKRLRQHNGEIKGGARYTQSRRPCQLVYRETVESRRAALKRELEIKKLSKSLKETLIRSTE